MLQRGAETGKATMFFFVLVVFCVSWRNQMFRSVSLFFLSLYSDFILRTKVRSVSGMWKCIWYHQWVAFSSPFLSHLAPFAKINNNQSCRGLCKVCHSQLFRGRYSCRSKQWGDHNFYIPVVPLITSSYQILTLRARERAANLTLVD